MSWFDATGLANIAKTALKEAQKTIDKALDIKDEAHVAPTNTPVDPGLEDFFGTWGLTQSGNIKPVKRNSIEDKPNQESITSSLWGSFTGSFFDNKESQRPEKLSASNSLEDTLDASSEHFNQSKLVVQQSEESDSVSLLRDEKENEINISGKENKKENLLQFVDINLSKCCSDLTNFFKPLTENYINPRVRNELSGLTRAMEG